MRFIIRIQYQYRLYCSLSDANSAVRDLCVISVAFLLQHMMIMEDMLKDFLLGEHLLLVGNQVNKRHIKRNPHKQTLSEALDIVHSELLPNAAQWNSESL